MPLSVAEEVLYSLLCELVGQADGRAGGRRPPNQQAPPTPPLVGVAPCGPVWLCGAL